MAWPPTTNELRQEITTKRSDDSLHRILQDAVNTVHSYGLDDATSENKCLQLAVADVKFDALDMEERDGVQLLKAYERTRKGILTELGRLRRRAKHGLNGSGAPSVPEAPEAPTAHGPVRYLSYNEFLTRYPSTTPPKKADGQIDRARMELLLDDAAAWCASVIPGNLIRGGIMLPTGDVPAALLAVCRQVSSDLVSMWLSPRGEKYTADCAQCEAAASKRLMATAQASTGLGSAGSDDVPETPITTTTTRYLLASEDDTFTAPEVILTDTSGDTALQIPSDAIPDGETRFIAYARPASLGDYVTVYFYPDGHPSTRDVLAGYDIGPDLDLAGVSCRLLRSKGAYRDNANTRLIDAR